jgi:hypothetical protein
LRTSGGAANQTRIFTESLASRSTNRSCYFAFVHQDTSINEQIKSFSKLSEGTKTTIVVVAALAAVIPLVLLLVF